MQPTHSESAKAAVWSQLVSLLAQIGEKIDFDLGAKARLRVAELQHDVPIERRKFVAESVSGKIGDPATLLLFGQDAPAVAAPVLRRAQISAAQWSEIMPDLPSSSRALLRERRDLPETVTRMLAIYGIGDSALPAPNGLARQTAEGGAPIEIRDLVARIEAYKQERDAGITRTAPEPRPHDLAARFRFETDRLGTLCWVEGAPRGPLIGISIATMAAPQSFGVDGHAAGAFRKRAPFRNARLLAAGNGSVGGDWLISADPVFDASDGRFQGYRGLARRSERGEQAGLTSADGSPIPADAIRQLVHELRSPLNAIRGFAEMIEGQLLGPVSCNYREKARSIAADSLTVATIVDDIDAIARLENGSTPESSGVIDLIPTFDMIVAGLRQRSAQLNVAIAVNRPNGAAFAAVDQDSGTRVIERFLSTMVGSAASGETLLVEISYGPAAIMIGINRPQLPGALTDTQSSPLSEAAKSRWSAPPALGLGFNIRLIRQMASAIGGQFMAEADKFTLILPRAHDTQGKTKESG